MASVIGHWAGRPHSSVDRVAAAVAVRASDLIWLIALVAAGSPVESAYSQEGPFRTRNLSPLVTIFGMPTWRTTAQALEISVTSELANHYRLSKRGTDTLILDAETWRNNLAIAAPIGEHWSVSADISHYRQFGGVLDDVVDAWHSIFSLPDGGRNNRPEGNVFFQIADSDGVFYSLAGRASGIGDAQVTISRQVGRAAGLHVSGFVKLPTGDEDVLAGSGSTDFGLTMQRQHSVTFRDRPASYYWGIGVLRLGEAQRVRFEQRRSGYVGVVGGSWQFGRRLGAKAQIDMHSALYESELEEIGEKAFQATIGGWWQIGKRGLLEFGVNEDLEVSTSPDVVIHMNFRWSWQ